MWLSIFFSNARLSHFHLSASCLGNADAAFIAWLTCRGRVISDQEDNTQTKTLLHMNCTNSCTFTLFSPGQVSSVFLKPLSETKISVAWLDTVDLIAWNDGASFLLLICLNRWSALSARSRWCYGQLIPSSILSIDEVSILIISELAGGMVFHCCYLHWLMAFFHIFVHYSVPQQIALLLPILHYMQAIKQKI